MFSLVLISSTRSRSIECIIRSESGGKTSFLPTFSGSIASMISTRGMVISFFHLGASGDFALFLADR